MKNKFLMMVAASFLISSMTSSPLWAEARSATVRVSCTITPMIELSSGLSTLTANVQGRQASAIPTRNELALTGSGSQVSVNTNLGKNYTLSESATMIAGASAKVFSVTAL